MNSLQIEKLLAADDKFLGCFPHDMLPPFPKQFPRSLIINTDDSSKPGDHWVGLVLNKDKCFYFDSYGLPILQKNIVKNTGSNFMRRRQQMRMEFLYVGGSPSVET